MTACILHLQAFLGLNARSIGHVAKPAICWLWRLHRREQQPYEQGCLMLMLKMLTARLPLQGNPHQGQP